MIFVGKLVSVGVEVMFVETDDRTSVLATAKLPPIMMIEIRAAKMPVSTSRRLLIWMFCRDCH